MEPPPTSVHRWRNVGLGQRQRGRTERRKGPGARGRGRRDMVLTGGLPGLTVNEKGWQFTRCTSPCRRGIPLRSHSVLVLCLVAQSCPSLCNPMDCSLPGSSIHRISQARIMEWIAISFFRSPALHRDRMYVSCICLLHWQENSLPTGGNWEASLTFYPPIIVLSFQTNISVLLGVYMRSNMV